ncbi:hypothetical protein CANCADRAFT_2526 [Tortispora caseinolytica NRRL Y-17796]|uniref:Nudix hydrolase domain-containing protein n=1 Tax=Tortispora caseinolytica NRRL Y-17796 TaxID=767744 RepID=A0A1E4TGB7_9ASCO|nr:hypothetical protein CANCADRAFT_2526 [Tortispora caseinolytica NRRL Y-17796]
MSRKEGITLSSSLVLLDKQKRILLVSRPSSGTYALACVFPGGATDPEDLDSEYTALRETYEETGIMISSTGTGKLHALYDGSQMLPYAKSAEIAGVDHESMKKALLPFSTWITPKNMPRRFRTTFFLAEIDEEVVDRHGAKVVDAEGLMPVPKSAEGEATQLRWVTPTQLLQEFKDGKVILFPPQFYIAHYLAQFSPKEASDRMGMRVISPIPIRVPGKKGEIIMDWGCGESGHVYQGKGGPKFIVYKKTNDVKL